MCSLELWLFANASRFFFSEENCKCIVYSWERDHSLVSNGNIHGEYGEQVPSSLQKSKMKYIIVQGDRCILCILYFTSSEFFVTGKCTTTTCLSSYLKHTWLFSCTWLYIYLRQDHKNIPAVFQISIAVVLTPLGIPGSREPCGAASIRLTVMRYQ
jgi:hypothetical protein